MAAGPCSPREKNNPFPPRKTGWPPLSRVWRAPVRHLRSCILTRFLGLFVSQSLRNLLGPSTDSPKSKRPTGSAPYSRSWLGGNTSLVPLHGDRVNRVGSELLIGSLRGTPMRSHRRTYPPRSDPVTVPLFPGSFAGQTRNQPEGLQGVPLSFLAIEEGRPPVGLNWEIQPPRRPDCRSQGPTPAR